MRDRIVGRAVLSAALYVAAFLLPKFCREEGLPVALRGDENRLLWGVVVIAGAFIGLAAWAMWNYKVRAKPSMMVAAPAILLLQLAGLWLVTVAGILFAGGNPV